VPLLVEVAIVVVEAIGVGHNVAARKGVGIGVVTGGVSVDGQCIAAAVVAGAAGGTAAVGTAAVVAEDIIGGCSRRLGQIVWHSSVGT